MIDTSDCLDLMMLNSANPNSVIAFARRNRDVMASEFGPGPENPALADLLSFAERIGKGVENGPLAKPNEAELFKFGNDLFRFCFPDRHKGFYDALPSTHIRLQFLSCHKDLKKVPWEFIQDPAKTPGPQRTRSIVRIVPCLGDDSEPLPVGAKLKVLFVASYPIDQDRVTWSDIERRISRSLVKYPIELEKCIPGTWDGFCKAVKKFKPDVVHFSGHGAMGAAGTQLLFMEPDTNNSQPVNADHIAVFLRGRGIRLIVLSACETSSQARVIEKEYSVLAETLVNEGINAVVANQFPLPDDTAGTFAGSLYEKLLETGDIDLAVAEGRQNLFDYLEIAQPAQANLEWGIPTLHRRITGARIFSI
jgi:hypothetical protein